jgi:D-alanyl-D-alanine carboxypeptidase
MKNRPRHLLRPNLLIAGVIIVAIAVGAWWESGHRNATPNATSTPHSVTVKKPTSRPTQQQFDKTQYSLNDPTSPWVIVNKGRILPSDYVPNDLVTPNVPLRVPGSSEMKMRQQTATALEKMFVAAAQDNVKLMVASAYRSYSLQVSLYNGYVASMGKAAADASSARPGHSEHQTGWALDVEPASRSCEVEQCFADTAEGKWVAANSYKYGFVIRYQQGKDAITGYEYEPWHIRYIGTDLAAEIHKTDQTLEQYFDLPLYADYPAQSYQLKTGT